MGMVWLRGLIGRRLGRLLATVIGIGLAVALVAALGSFLTSSQSTMTARATRTVAVDWQVQVQAGARAGDVLRQVRSAAGVRLAEPVQFASTTGFRAAVAGSTQTTGPGVVLGLPPGYRSSFPDQIRTLSGADSGVLLAQQTAANLRVRPGDQIQVGRQGRGPATVTVTGIVDLPQADTLFQKVGAPPQSQPAAPPDNVMLVPASVVTALFGTSAGAGVSTQIHVDRAPPPAADPATAYAEVLAAAHNLEAQLAGSGLVGDNLAAALDAARGDAAYAQLLFLFLGLPGALVAAMLTAAVVAAGAGRRRAEQALLRVRGLDRGLILRLAVVEALFVGVSGGLLGIGVAAAAGRLAFGTAGARWTATTFGWFGVAFAAGLAITAVTVLVPAIRDARNRTVLQARAQVGRSTSSWWTRIGLDIMLLASAGVVFAASSRNNYTLVLAPEGVASISVSYWAFLGPTLFWIGAALLLWRLVTLGLVHGRRFLTRLIAPLTGTLARPGAAAISRQQRPLARAVVLLALAISFAVSTSVFNSTYQQQAEADAQLTNGADVTVTPAPGLQLGPGRAAAFAGTPGVRSVEPIQHRFAYVGADLQDLYGVRPASIGSATALQDAYFQGGTAQQLMAKLSARPDSILVSDETVKDFQLSPGDQLNLRLQDSRTKKLQTITFHYAGIVKEFPTAPKDSFFVANADYVARATGSAAVGAFLVDTGGHNQSQIADRLRRKLGSTAAVTDLTQTRAQVGSSLTSVDLAGLTRLELGFAVVLAAAAGGLVLAVGLAERRRALAIIAVLGGRRSQLRGLVLSEAALVLVGGLGGGALIATGLSAMLIKVLTGVFDPPPSTVAAPAGYLVGTVLIVVAAVSVAALATARTSTRPPVEELRDL